MHLNIVTEEEIILGTPSDLARESSFAFLPFVIVCRHSAYLTLVLCKQIKNLNKQYIPSYSVEVNFHFNEIWIQYSNFDSLQVG